MGRTPLAFRYRWRSVTVTVGVPLPLPLAFIEGVERFFEKEKTVSTEPFPLNYGPCVI